MENKSYKVVFSFEYERGNMSYSIVEPEMYGAMVQNKVDFEGFLFSRNNNMEIPLSVTVDLYLNPTTQDYTRNLWRKRSIYANKI